MGYLAIILPESECGEIEVFMRSGKFFFIHLTSPFGEQQRILIIWIVTCSKNPVNQATAKATLTQMINIVLRRMESDVQVTSSLCLCYKLSVNLVSSHGASSYSAA